MGGDIPELGSNQAGGVPWFPLKWVAVCGQTSMQSARDARWIETGTDTDGDQDLLPMFIKRTVQPQYLSLALNKKGWGATSPLQGKAGLPGKSKYTKNNLMA